MKIALDWIAQYLDRPVGAEEAAEALLNAGLPIESIETVAGTQVLDVEVTSNRTDCLSHIGLARELAALLGRTLKTTPPTANATGPAVATLTKLQIDDPQGGGCPYYSARVIQNVKVGPSPEWLIQRLESIGLRSINNVVDVTNFVLMETGQPLHAFDFNGLAEKCIVVRRARQGEKMVAINNSEYVLSPDHLVIADAIRPVAIAGVMGGKETEVSVGTTNVLLESARFDPLLIRSTARALALKSDSSFRFERGLDPTIAEWASLRAAQLILELAGGTLAAGVLIAGQASHKPLEVKLRLSHIRTILGIDVPPLTALKILTALQFSPRIVGDEVICLVPSHRLDVEREIDLIEEVARVYGYKHLTVLDRVVHSVQPERQPEKARRVIRSALTASGFSEAVTLTMISKPEALLFLPATTGVPIGLAHTGWKGEVLRPSLLPSLLAVRRTNQYAGTPDARVFEIAEAFWQSGDPATTPPAQVRSLALLGNSVAEVRGSLETVLARLTAAARLSVTPLDYPWFAPGAAGAVVIESAGKKHPLGCIGVISDTVQKQYDLRQSAAAAEVDWDALVALLEPVRRASPLPRFPGVNRDISVVLDESIRWADLEAALAQAHLAFLKKIDFVGTFRNKQIGPGKKSLTLSLAFGDPEATLRSEQVDTQVKSAVDILTQKFAATLRA